MAEPISIIAGISSVASLADASCALAGSLYKTFRTIKDAPRAMQRLSKELGKFHDLLQDVYKLLQCYSTSLLVTEDGLSVDSVQSMLKECQTELESVQRTTASFKPGPNRFKNAAARFAWVVDESKVKQHCQTIEQLRQHIDTGLSVLSHQHDIKARERYRSIHSQVAEVRNVLNTSATETRDLVSSKVGTVRSAIEQVAVEVAIGQDGLQTSIQSSHDHLYQKISYAGVQTSHGIERIQNDLRDINFLMQHEQQHNLQEFLQMSQSIKNIDSMLSRVLSLYSGREESLLECDLVKHPRLEGIMFSLLMMRSSLVSAISELKSNSSLDVSEDETEFLLGEFENLVAFSHEASALRIRQRCIRAEGEDWQSHGSTNHTSMTRNYVLDVDSFSQPIMTRRERRTSSHADASGRLKLSFGNRAGDVSGRPASILDATLSYVPNQDFHSTGVYATFRKEMRVGFKPSVNRSLRAARIFPRGMDSTFKHLIEVLQADDLQGLQRMLSCGQIRPWDQELGGDNLLTMAVCCMDNFPSEILDYLLVDAWDIENSNRLQSVLWSKRLFRGSLDTVFQLSRRMSALGQTINTDLVHDILEGLDRLLNCFLDSAQIIIDDVCKLLINQEADIENRDPFSEETVLLVAAEGDGNISLKLMPVLSQLGADYSVVDYKGRTPLHLALKPSRSYTARPLRRPSLEKKLVHLLQAGCLIHAVDNYGRTPTDVARKWRRTQAWEAALEVVGKLDCARSKCQCETIKIENSESCKATMSAFNHGLGEYEDEDEDFYNHRRSNMRCFQYPEHADYSEDDENFLEDSEGSGRDGDEHEDPWITTDEDVDESQDLDLCEADNEDQDTDMDEDEDGHQNIETNEDEDEDGHQNIETNEDEDEDETSNLKQNKENLEKSLLHEGNLRSITPTSPQIAKPEPSPTLEPHHDPIALGQHHLWMI